MNILTNLLLLLSLITLIFALPRHKRDETSIDENQEKLNTNSEKQENLNENLLKSETSQTLSKVDGQIQTDTNNNLNEPKNPKEFNYASLQSQIIATNILKDNIENSGNEVFSPLGISTILAILGEASQGETYKEFQNALGYPNDKMLLRESFKDILKAYKQNNYDTTPSFKTWFYIYRNNTAKEGFRDIIRKYYTVEVKEIDNIEFDWDTPKTSSQSLSSPSSPSVEQSNMIDTKEENKNSEKKVNVEEVRKITNLKTEETQTKIPDDPSVTNSKNNSKDIIGFEDLKKSDFFDQKLSKVSDPDSDSISLTDSSRPTSSEANGPTSSASINEKNGLPKEDISTAENTENKVDDLIKESIGMDDKNVIAQIIKEKEASKFDAVVDDKQYVEVPIIKAEIAEENEEKRKREEKETPTIEAKVEEITIKESSSPLTSETTSKDLENLDNDNNKSDEMKIKTPSSQSEAKFESHNIFDIVLKEMNVEKEALNDYMKENNNKEIKSEIAEAEAAAIDELKKEEKIIEAVVLEENQNKNIILPIEVPIANSDPNQIRRIDLVDINDEENETINQDEKIDVLRKHNKEESDLNNGSKGETIVFVESKEPEKITLSIKKFDDENSEIMEAMETSFTKQKIQPRSLLRKDDIASALSANSITGRENPSKTKMLLFNGLYYRGNWAHPFMELRCDRMESFHSSSGKTLPIRMMKTRGDFKMAKLESLDSDALELPYENQRFSFIIIVPRQIDGLNKLIEKLQPVDLQMLQTHLTDSLTTINLPKFEIEQTSRSEKTMKRLGINRIFSPYTSNFSNLSDEPGLHVDEIVQHVNLKVDEGAASENALSASNSQGRAISNDNSNGAISTDNEGEKHFDVNRPFLYFVMDRTSNFVMVAGKLIEPQIKEEFGFES